MGKTIEIPEGYEARIEGNKVILERKKSEDERLRSLLVWQVHRNIEDETNDLAKSIYDGIKGHDPDLEESIEDWKKCLAYLEKQKEQNPAEWSEEYRKEDLRTRFAFYTYKDEDGVLYLSNVFVEETSRNKGFGTKILQAAEMVAQTIGALTIRLKVKQNTPANDWYRRHGYGYLVFEDGYDWLEKNLEYLKPKQKWSEADKLHLNNAILVAKKEWGVNSYTARWLESLRDNYKKCNSHWKPSEEQMEALDCAIGMFGYMRMADTLRELYADLKKL